jgi:transcriptional regulator with XRE-family HTH domain
MPTLQKKSKEAAAFSEIRKKLEADWEYQRDLALLKVTEQMAKAMADRGISRADLARSLGVSRAYITQFFRGKHNLGVDTIYKVAFALGFRPAIQLRPLEQEFSRCVKPADPHCWEQLTPKAPVVLRWARTPIRGTVVVSSKGITADAWDTCDVPTQKEHYAEA